MISPVRCHDARLARPLHVELGVSVHRKDGLRITFSTSNNGNKEMTNETASAKSDSQNVQDRVQDAAKQTFDGATNVARDVSARAKDAFGNMAKGVSAASEFVDRKAAEATAALGGQLKSAGKSVRDYSSRDGESCERSETIAQTLENAGDYVQQKGLKGIEDDLISIVKNNPIPAILMGIAVGFLGGLTIKRRV